MDQAKTELAVYAQWIENFDVRNDNLKEMEDMNNSWCCERMRNFTSELKDKLEEARELYVAELSEFEKRFNEFLEESEKNMKEERENMDWEMKKVKKGFELLKSDNN
jgi:hypothetical protein